MTRTEYLIKNPKLIDALGIQQGIPYRELQDFRQYVMLTSLENVDSYDSTKAKMSTYAGNFIRCRAVDYLRKLRRVPKPLADFATPFLDERDSGDDELD